MQEEHHANIVDGMVRYAQIRDMANHQICTEKNQRYLLEAKMTQLSMLVREIHETDWMFDDNNNHNGSGNSSSGGGGSEGSGKPVGFHKGLQERW